MRTFRFMHVTGVGVIRSELFVGTRLEWERRKGSKLSYSTVRAGRLVLALGITVIDPPGDDSDGIVLHAGRPSVN